MRFHSLTALGCFAVEQGMIATHKNRYFRQQSCCCTAVTFTLWALALVTGFEEAEAQGLSTASQLTTALLNSYVPSRQEYVGIAFNQSLRELNQLQPQDYSAGPPPGWEFISPSLGWRKIATPTGPEGAAQIDPSSAGSRKILNTLDSNGHAIVFKNRANSAESTSRSPSSSMDGGGAGLAHAGDHSFDEGGDNGIVHAQESFTGSGGQASRWALHPTSGVMRCIILHLCTSISYSPLVAMLHGKPCPALTTCACQSSCSSCQHPSPARLPCNTMMG